MFRMFVLTRPSGLYGKLGPAGLLRSALERLDQPSAEQASLLNDLTSAEERERVRIAADIHDDTVQVLGALALELELAQRAAPAGDQTVLLSKACAEVRAAATRLRGLVSELIAPPPETGLHAAVESYCGVLFGDAGIAYELGGDTGSVSPESCLLAYRLAQEALRNVLKHARAGRVAITFSSTGQELVMSISDNGVGLAATGGDWPPLHAGLHIIRRRAEAAGGSAATSVGLEGRGTSVQVRLPLAQWRRP